MNIFVMQIDLRASWVHSLKEKRMVTKSLISKLKNKFNVSVGEVSNQDIHQILSIGITGLGASNSQLDSIMENIIEFIYENTDAQIIKICKETDVYKF